MGRTVGLTSSGANAVEKEVAGEPPAADITAVLTVLKRRSPLNQQREFFNVWHLDFGNAVLKQANLQGAHFEGASFREAHLEGARLGLTQLKNADFRGAQLKKADFRGAQLREADFREAHLEEADFQGAQLREADFRGAHLERANFRGAHLERANLTDTEGLSKAQLRSAFRNAATQLPAHLTRPAHRLEGRAGPAPSQPNAPEPPDI